jgi:hypothetical protein
VLLVVLVLRKGFDDSKYSRTDLDQMWIAKSPLFARSERRVP